MTPIRVVLAEDHTIVREGLRALLASQSDLEVVGEAADGESAVDVATSSRCDVAVVDLNLPRLPGVEVIRAIRARCSATAVIVLSMHSTEDYVRSAVRAGARGYLVKGSGLEDLVAAIRTVHAGGTFFSAAAARAIRETSGPSELTPREREVLALVARERSSPEIAVILDVSVKTVEAHRSRIMAKLGVHNVAGLVRHAIRLGLASADD